MAVKASERLRELDANRRYWPPNSGQRELYEHSIADALPLIADVVEAAEAIPGIRSGAWPELDSRLTALRDALEGGD